MTPSAAGAGETIGSARAPGAIGRPPGGRAVPETLLATAGLVGLVVIALARSLDDFPAADCFSLLVKARELSFLQILSPDQTQVVNPYWRPLFVLFLKATAPLGEASFVAQHLLAIAAHALAAFTAWRLGRAIMGERPGLWLGALLFAVSPVSVDTVAWTTVSYAVLSGAFAAVTLLFALAWLARPSRRFGFGFAIAFVLSLMASQSGYALVPILALYLLVYWSDRTRIADRRAALLLVATIALLVLGHFFGLESRLSDGQATRMAMVPGGPLARLVATLPKFPAALLGLPSPGPGLFALLVVGAVTLTGRRLGRGGMFTLLASLAATLPYSLVSYTDRYAYFAAILFFPWLAALIASFHLPVVRLTLVRSAARAVILALIGFHAWQSQGVLAKWDRLGRQTRQVYEDIGSVAGEVTRAEQLRLVNMPSFFRWLVYYRLDLPSRSLLRWERYLQTPRVRFNPPEIRLDKGEILLAYEHDRLVRRRPDELEGKRIDYPSVGFPHRIIVRRGGEREILTAVDRYPGDPREVVVLEETPPDLVQPMSGGTLLSWEVNRELHAAVYRVRMRSRGVVVIVLPYYPSDPLAAAIRQTGRVPDIVAATVDGKPNKVYPAFYHFAAVVVPDGEHTVMLRQATRN